MCCSISSSHSWLHEPVVLSKEKCPLFVVTTIRYLLLVLQLTAMSVGQMLMVLDISKSMLILFGELQVWQY
jgi:hypothetical protein